MADVRSRFELGTSRTKLKIVSACQRARLNYKLRKVKFCQNVSAAFWSSSGIQAIGRRYTNDDGFDGLLEV